MKPGVVGGESGRTKGEPGAHVTKKCSDSMVTRGPSPSPTQLSLMLAASQFPGQEEVGSCLAPCLPHSVPPLTV